MITQNAWLETAPDPAALPLADGLPAQVDVAVVGSGYTGLSAARTLLRGGATVAVLESETIGWGASSRNGGMTSPGVKQSIVKVMQRYGETTGRRIWQATLDAVDLVGAIIREENIDCDWDPRGMLGLAYKESHFEAMRNKARWYKDTLDYDVQIVERADLRAEIGTDAYFGGSLDPVGAGLNPARYVLGLARAVGQAGGQLCDQARVTAIRRTEHGFEVHTTRGTLISGEVIVATNGYTDRTVPGLQPKVFPVGSYIIVTEPLPPALRQELSPRGRMFYDSKWFLNYFRLTPDGRMLWGGRNNLSPDLDLAESANTLRAQMVRVFPQLAGVPISHSWTGRLGITFDLMPNIGRQDGIHYAFGYGGHGIHISTYLGREIARLVAGEIDSSPFMDIPHSTMFFYRNEPWFLPVAAIYYRLLDAIS